MRLGPCSCRSTLSPVLVVFHVNTIKRMCRVHFDLRSEVRCCQQAANARCIAADVRACLPVVYFAQTTLCARMRSAHSHLAAPAPLPNFTVSADLFLCTNLFDIHAVTALESSALVAVMCFSSSSWAEPRARPGVLEPRGAALAVPHLVHAYKRVLSAGGSMPTCFPVQVLPSNPLPLSSCCPAAPFPCNRSQRAPSLIGVVGQAAEGASDKTRLIGRQCRTAPSLRPVACAASRRWPSAVCADGVR